VFGERHPRIAIRNAWPETRADRRHDRAADAGKGRIPTLPTTTKIRKTREKLALPPGEVKLPLAGQSYPGTVETGGTPYGYVFQVKLEKARSMICDRNSNIMP
jgi:hypothetical protein